VIFGVYTPSDILLSQTYIRLWRVIFGVYTPSDILPKGKVLDLIIASAI